MDPIFIQTVIVAVLTAIGAGVRQWLKAVLTPRRIQAFVNQARLAISAAEEVGNVLELSSPEKYQWAEDALRDLTKRSGLRLTDAELNAYIHALLYEEHVAEAIALGDAEAVAAAHAA